MVSFRGTRKQFANIRNKNRNVAAPFLYASDSRETCIMRMTGIRYLLSEGSAFDIGL